jgi:hypothetical protein
VEASVNEKSPLISTPSVSYDDTVASQRSDAPSPEVELRGFSEGTPGIVYNE